MLKVLFIAVTALTAATAVAAAKASGPAKDGAKSEYIETVVTEERVLTPPEHGAENCLFL